MKTLISINIISSLECAFGYWSYREHSDKFLSVGCKALIVIAQNRPDLCPQVFASLENILLFTKSQRFYEPAIDSLKILVVTHSEYITPHTVTTLEMLLKMPRLSWSQKVRELGEGDYSYEYRRYTQGYGEYVYGTVVSTIIEIAQRRPELIALKTIKVFN